MGVPTYFKNIITKYDEILISQNVFHKQINNIFFDLNCLIHPTIHNLTDENIMNDEIYKNILKIIDICKPKDLVYIAIDGVCPRSKIEQQRKRRFKSSLEKKLWDKNAITPGTNFMNNLNNYLNKQKYPIKTIISDSSIRGEGEHKIMEYLKNNFNKNDINIVYGLDADLIHLSLIRNNNIFLLRERTEYNIEKIDTEFIFLDINLLKKYLINEIKNDIVLLNEQEIINDYIFLCFFVGNDFINNTPSINIRYKGLEYLLEIYNKLQDKYGGLFQLIKNNKIDLNNFKKFIKLLEENERNKLKKILYIRDIQENKMKNNYSEIFHYYSNDKNLDNFSEELISNFKNNLPILDRKNEKIVFKDINNFNNKYYLFNKYLHHNYDPSYEDILNEEKINICKNYLESIIWTTNYYFDSCISWRWFYEYNYPPLIYDLNKYIENIDNLDVIKYDNNNLNSEEQLLLVLPLKSIFLNKNLQKEDYYYPNKFYNNTFMKRYSWEGHSVLPS